MKYQLVLQFFYTVLFVITFWMCCQALWKVKIYMSPTDWLKINKCGFQMANRFAQRTLFKFFIAKSNPVRTDEFAAIPILLPFQSLDIPKKIYSLARCQVCLLKTKTFNLIGTFWHILFLFLSYLVAIF